MVDGGTLRLRDRVVRLQGVEPPPRGTTCGPRDGSGEDCGAAATNALAALVREAPVACRITGEDRLGRPYGICQASGTELNRAVVAAGWARADRARPELKQAEAGGARRRSRRLGIDPTAVGERSSPLRLKSRCKIAWQLRKKMSPRRPAAQRKGHAQADVTGRANGLTIFRLTIAIALQHKGFRPERLRERGGGRYL